MRDCGLRTSLVRAQAIAVAIVRHADHRERRTGLSRDDRVQLPATGKQFEATAPVPAKHLSMTERQVIQSAADKHIALVKSRVALVERVVIDVNRTDGIEAEIAIGVVNVMRPRIRACEDQALGRVIVELCLQAVVMRNAVCLVANDFAEIRIRIRNSARRTKRCSVRDIAGCKVRALIADIADSHDCLRAKLVLHLQIVLLN